MQMSRHRLPGNARMQECRRISKDIPQPGAISNYNSYMNAVDRSDQILATHNVLRKSVRWQKTLFLHLIDMTIVNSFFFIPGQLQPSFSKRTLPTQKE